MTSRMSRLASSRGTTGLTFNLWRRTWSSCAPGHAALRVAGISRRTRCRSPACHQHVAQVRSILVPADELAHVLAAGAVAALSDLLIDEGLQCVRQGDVHRAHGVNVGRLASFGSIRAGSPAQIWEAGGRRHDATGCSAERSGIGSPGHEQPFAPPIRFVPKSGPSRR